MDFIQEVLQRAQEEGRIGSDSIPWEEKVPVATPKRKAQKERRGKKNAGRNVISSFRVPTTLYQDCQKLSVNLFSAASEGKQRVIGFTSATHGEGTSTLIAVTASILAEYRNRAAADERKSSGEKDVAKGGVALIDASGANPVIHKIFGLSTAPGLHERLAGEERLTGVVQHVLVDDAHLDIIAAGAARENTFELFTKTKIKNLLRDLSKRYEYVFVDIPPLLHRAESILLCKCCDAVVFIIRAGQTRVEVVHEAKALLESAGVRVLGSVLNRRKYYIPEGIYRRLK